LFFYANLVKLEFLAVNKQGFYEVSCRGFGLYWQLFSSYKHV